MTSGPDGEHVQVHNRLAEIHDRYGTSLAEDCFWVVESGADAKVSRESSQDIKLVLTPRDIRAPLDVPVMSGREGAPLISGREEAGECSTRGSRLPTPLVECTAYLQFNG